jgi:hypothetical protein
LLLLFGWFVLEIGFLGEVVDDGMEAATDAIAEAALSNKSEVLNAGEKTREESKTAKCSSKVQRGDPSGNRFTHSVSNKQRSLILLSIQFDEDDRSN